MRKSSAVLFGVLAGVVLASPSLFACGDKLVLLGRGIRFQRMVATKHPATILVYLNPGAGIAAADKEYQLRSLLKFAGHKPHAVTSAAEVRTELGSGKYDVVLADYADAAGLEKEVREAKARPALIPVVYNPTASRRAAAEKEFSCLITPAKKNYDLLSVVDQAMVSRAGNTSPLCKKSRA
jgi:ABC-type sugar transport system substrate-binding protein